MSWKKMAVNMQSQYKGGSIKCRGFTDGTEVCMSSKGWSVFFATINKSGAKADKPRPKSINETIFQETAKQVVDEMIQWAVEKK